MWCWRIVADVLQQQSFNNASYWRSIAAENQQKSPCENSKLFFGSRLRIRSEQITVIAQCFPSLLVVLLYERSISCHSEDPLSVIPLWRSLQSHLSFHFLTVPALCCVPLSPQIAHWPACIYSANATRFVTTATCYHPPHRPTQPPQKDNYFFIFTTTCTLSDSALQPKCAVMLSYGPTLKCHSKRERLLDSNRGI